ncbi:hypothetical protein ACFQ0B_49345 [Nonomuraea thailandensis]
MSHLDTPRLTFAGRFLSDVPTMNNNAESFGSRTRRRRAGTPTAAARSTCSPAR